MSGILFHPSRLVSHLKLHAGASAADVHGVLSDSEGDDEHERLLNRTAELAQEHAELDLSHTPFNQADHDAHRADLDQHQADLAEHREHQRGEPERSNNGYGSPLRYRSVFH